jgi:hypothetical protein
LSFWRKKKNTMREAPKLKPKEGDEVEMVQLTKIELWRSSSKNPARRKGFNGGIPGGSSMVLGRKRERVWKRMGVREHTGVCPGHMV